MMPTNEMRHRFRRLATAGIFFQGGAAAVDTSTIIAALVHSLTGSAFAVGAAAGIARFGWLFPQLFVAYATRRRRRMPFYLLGALGRVACLIAVAALLEVSDNLTSVTVVTGFFLLWSLYAFVSGIVAVPYNDIVARSIPSLFRSRLLALRFFGGGLLALVVAYAAHRLLDSLAFPTDYAGILALGALLLLVSTLSFFSAGEPLAPPPPKVASRFGDFLLEGVTVFRQDRRFRLFICAQWLGGLVSMALPFYVLQVTASVGGAADVAWLLAAQMMGALGSNPLWGWWGDYRGKRSLLELVAGLGLLAPALTLLWLLGGQSGGAAVLPWFTVVFLLLGAANNGSTIAMLGYLMEISPDDRRPAYSGYFNVIVAPAALLPIAGAAIAETISYAALFAISGGATLLQVLVIRRLRNG